MEGNKKEARTIRQSHTAKADEQKKRKELKTVLADPEEEILMALAQIKVIDGLLLGQAENSEALELEGMAEAACRLTQASLDTFERLDVVGLVVKARAAGRPGPK